MWWRPTWSPAGCPVRSASARCRRGGSGASARCGCSVACARSGRGGRAASLRGHARAVAGVVGAAPARRCRGDRLRAAGQGAGRRAPQDRRAARASAGDRPRLAARVRWPCGGGACLRAALGSCVRPRARVAAAAGAAAVRQRGRALGGRGAGWGLVLRHQASPWELAVALTGGLLHGRPRDPPGSCLRSCGSSRTTSLMSSCAGGCGSSAAAMRPGPSAPSIGA